jgi:hypothetical protein
MANPKERSEDGSPARRRTQVTAADATKPSSPRGWTVEPVSFARRRSTPLAIAFRTADRNDAG